MSLYFNGKKVDSVSYKGEDVAHIYYKSVLVFSAEIYFNLIIRARRYVIAESNWKDYRMNFDFSIDIPSQSHLKIGNDLIVEAKIIEKSGVNEGSGWNVTSTEKRPSKHIPVGVGEWNLASSSNVFRIKGASQWDVQLFKGCGIQFIKFTYHGVVITVNIDDVTSSVPESSVSYVVLNQKITNV